MGLAQPDDRFLINRDDTTYQIKQSELMAKIQDTDFMAVNRDDVTYKITGADVIDSFVSELEIQNFEVVPKIVKTRSQLFTQLQYSGGQAPITYEFVWYQKNETQGIAETAIPDSNAPGIYVDDTYAGAQVACQITITDNLGSTVTQKTDYIDPIELFGIAPQINSVTIEDAPGNDDSNRFTNQTFLVKTDLINGQPNSIKGIRAYTYGDFIQTYETDVITSYDEELVNPENYLTSNFPIVNKASPFYPYANQNEYQFGPRARLENNDYMTFEPRFPVETRINNLGYRRGWLSIDIPFGDQFTYTHYYAVSSNLTGKGIYGELKFIQGWGRFNIPSADDKSQAWETIYGIRWQRLPGAYGITTYTGINGFASGEHMNYIDGANGSGGTPYFLGQDMYLQEDKWKIITFASDSNLATADRGDTISEIGGTATGKIYRVEGNQIYLTKGSDTNWTPGAKVLLQPKPAPEDKFYLVIDTEGNVIDLDQNEVSIVYTSMEENPTFEIKFPAVFSGVGGLPPDDELLPGTTLAVEVIATNDFGASGPITVQIQPGGSTSLLSEEEQEQIKLNYQTLELRRALSSTSGINSIVNDLLSQGYTQDQIDIALDSPRAIDGYYPLYTTEAGADTAGNGTSHTHTFDGVTYYMPNGVPYYHGNYSEPADTTSDSTDSGSSSSGGGSYGY